MSLLSAEDREYLAWEFQEKLQDGVVLHFFQNGNEASEITGQILEELAGFDSRIAVRRYSFPQDEEEAKRFGIDKAPAIVVAREDRDQGIRFYGMPAGYEFGSLVEDVIDVSRGETDLPPDVAAELQELDSAIHIQVFVTPTCPYCPRAVRTAHKFAMASDYVTADMVMATDFNDLATRYGVTAVPHMVVNEKVNFIGALPERQFLNEVLKGA
ncbi:MAG: thioredoxin family protein [Candidatus Bipolaricaulia bacterium]